MRDTVIIYVYGMLALTSGFLATFFGSKTWKRWNLLEPRTRWHDRYLLFASGIATLGLGLSIVTMFRVVGNLLFGISPILRHWTGAFIEVGLAVQLVGAGIIVWLADLDATRRGLWTTGMIVIAFLWLIFSVMVTYD